MRDWINFQRRCIARAFAHIVRADLRNFCGMAIVFAIGSIAHYARYGLQAVMDEWYIFLSYGLVATFVYLILKFVVYVVFVAPFREYEEQRRDAMWLQELLNARQINAPNYDHWDTVTEFSLWQAACLWVDEPANKDTMSLHASGVLANFKQSIKHKDISLNDRDNFHYVQIQASVYLTKRVSAPA